MIKQRMTPKMNGFLFLLLAIAGLWYGFNYIITSTHPFIGLSLIIASILLSMGLVVNQPNQALVLTFFGKYAGSLTDRGFFVVNPLCLRQKISLKVQNFESGKLKVNDANGNPILIGAVVVWRVVDSAKAVFDVESLEKFVNVQSESAIRNLTNRYPYDAHDKNVKSLRCDPDAIAEELRLELQKRLEIAGVGVLEANITHLAYSPEVAQLMLRRQQAEAILSARQQIVEGAISMVDMTLKKLPLELNENQKASIVNNLLVCLVSETSVSPIVATDSSSMVSG